jgi:hypothetical protein
MRIRFERMDVSLIHRSEASEHESSEKSEEQQADEILCPFFSEHVF